MRHPIKLPEFPWDKLTPLEKTASEHPDGMIKLTVGAPVDPVFPSIQVALSEAAALSGYPPTIGVPKLREAIVSSLERRYNMQGITAVLPAIGTKELIAGLPSFLRVDTVAYPELAYPTYEIAAIMADAKIVNEGADLTFINSPNNPSGEVLTVEQMREYVADARSRGAILVSDECYLGMGWTDKRPHSILDPAVCDGDHTGLLAIHSLSKTSNLAGYRSGFVVGDPDLIEELTLVRKHSGFMVPYPIQYATIAALNDDEQESFQKARYFARRKVLTEAITAAGFTIDHSDAGLYLWTTGGENCWDTARWFAERGLLVTPGDFYGEAGKEHVRIALTITDDDAIAAAKRLTK
ncbi:succinyldiaminopimelate transaminase [Corynebacterium pyruviciproducens]|uniref:Succinyldiaminopimelate transaminase n=1 Tax=Corynebacterium pyruviciproducens ATCC BAA-1742 TaxID=1125779 RepID=S2Z9A9_9CORY|nr:succinyldiaminopimelate transaminase [Corynebacterium pyruviciproducens]EPD70945.1 succinyldiaminopimelate transaminase [Corynebacterium pyruviciproducens ATCC BAA-1742]